MPQLVINRGINSYNRKNVLQFGPYFLVVSLIVFVVLITVIALMFSAKQVTKGYVLNKLEAEHQVLVKEGEQNEMQISQVRSLNFIQDSSKVRSMVRPNQVVFLNGESSIASR